MSDIVKRFREEQIDILHRHYYPTMHEQIADATLFKCLDELYNTKLDGKHTLQELLDFYGKAKEGQKLALIDTKGRFPPTSIPTLRTDVIAWRDKELLREGYNKVVHVFGEGE